VEPPDTGSSDSGDGSMAYLDSALVARSVAACWESSGDGMNSLCTAIGRDILECLSGSITTLQTPLLQSFTSPLVGLASVSCDILLATASRYSPSAAEWQLIGHGGFPPRRSSHCPTCPHSPCPESSGISSRKGCLGLTAPEHGRFHLVIFSQPTLMLPSLDRTLSFPSSNVSETWADLSDFQLVIYLVWVA
jgi:hypothetical protein